MALDFFPSAPREAYKHGKSWDSEYYFVVGICILKFLERSMMHLKS